MGENPCLHKKHQNYSSTCRRFLSRDHRIGGSDLIGGYSTGSSCSSTRDIRAAMGCFSRGRFFQAPACSSRNFWCGRFGGRIRVPSWFFRTHIYTPICSLQRSEELRVFRIFYRPNWCCKLQAFISDVPRDITRDQRFINEIIATQAACMVIVTTLTGTQRNQFPTRKN